MTSRRTAAVFKRELCRLRRTVTCWATGVSLHAATWQSRKTPCIQGHGEHPEEVRSMASMLRQRVPVY